jgi:hypothetical protein
LRFRTIGKTALNDLRDYKQFYVLLFAFIVLVLAGFWRQPSDVSIPAISGNAPLVNIIADREGIEIYDISSVLTDGGNPAPEAFLNLSSSSYSIKGTVRVPHGQSASVYIGISGVGKVTSPLVGWRFVGPMLERTFDPGTSKLELSLTLDNCNCATYRSPYLEAAAANVTSATPTIPGLLSVPGIQWQVMLSFQSSEVHVDDPTVPSDLSIVSAYPQAPINTTGSNDWSWPNESVGHIIASDPGASASRDIDLFYAGLLFGIAGSALIGSIQARFTEYAASKASNKSSGAKYSQEMRAHDVSSGGEMSLPDLTGHAIWEMDASFRTQLDRIKTDADKRQAVYDQVFRDSRGKSVSEVRKLLAREWRVHFAVDIPESELSENAKIIAAGNRIEFVVHINR